MVAMAFLLPTAAMANPTPNPYQGDDVIGNPFGGIEAEDIQPTNMKTSKDNVRVVGRLQDGELIPLAFGESDAQLWLGPCGGDGGPEIKVNAGTNVPVSSEYRPWYYITADEGVTIEPELEIYDYDAGKEFLIYETSFEDNARNYLEWEQVDGDCGMIGGYYDGWAWSDARASDGDHSFKSTMYDEYKNMQEDWIQMKCCKALDLTGQCSVKVQFDTYVAGEYAVWYVDTWSSSLYNPLDFLTFGFRDCSIPFNYWISTADSSYFAVTNSSGFFQPGSFYFFDTSVPLWNTEGVQNDYQVDGEFQNPMDYTKFVEKIDGKPGWWRVTAEFPLSAMPQSMAENFAIWFKWTSDKERVYEGAYVDNIKIYSIESLGEKIYQGHSQSWLTEGEDFDGTGHWFEFPLCWDGIEPGEYKAQVKIKNDEGTYDIEEELIFHIRDVERCEIRGLTITDDYTGDVIPDGGTVDYSTDVHITSTYHNMGNTPMTDVPLQATGYKIEDETLADYDMESGFSYYYFVGDYGQIYLSNDFAWSGSSSMAFNDPNTLHYGTYADGIGMLFGDPINMEGVKEAYWDHYYLGKLGAGDQFLTMFGAESGAYVYGGDILIDQNTKIDPWVGPMQPQGFYSQINLVDYWQIIETFGENRDANGNPTYGMLFGYILANNGDDSFYYDNEFDWSGAYVDDVTVKAKVRGDIAFRDQLVISGPCAPCETCTEQFVWEDVPYSCYDVVVECEGDEVSQEFCVLEELEKMGKADGVDYTECAPEAWCISDVVGNDCGNNGQGDQYALATNCDTHDVPVGVNEYLSLGECGVDVSHLDFNKTVAPPGLSLTFDGGIEDMATSGMLTVYASSDGGSSWSAIQTWDDIDQPFDEYFAANPAINLPAGTNKIAFHYSDESAWAWGAWVDNVDIGGTVYDFESGAMGWTVDDADGNLPTWALDTTLPYWASPDGGATGQFFLIDDDDAGSGAGPSTDNWLISPDLVTFSAGKATKFACDMETWSGGIPVGNPDGFVSSTWLQSLYGFARSGTEWAYSWAMGDVLTTPTISLECNPTLSFWTCAESSLNPMDLEVYCNGNLVFSDYGYTHTSYEEQIVDLSAYENMDVVIEFVGLTTDFYGQMLEDVVIEDETCGGPVEGDKIYVNMTYQVDLYDPAKVIVEYCDINLGNPNDYTIVGYDWHVHDFVGSLFSYTSPGWIACPGCNSVPDSFIDVYVNGELVIEDFTVLDTYNEETFSASPGDDIMVCYNGPDYIDTCGSECYAEYEHEWALLGPGGMILLQDGHEPKSLEGYGMGVPSDGCYTIGACEGCDSEECLCPDGVKDWCEVPEVQDKNPITGNAPGVCQNFRGVIEPKPETDLLCFRIRFDTSDPLFSGFPYAGPGIGFHLHEISISDIVFDPITGEISDFCDDFEDGLIDTPTMSEQAAAALNADCAGDPGYEWNLDCVTFGEHWEKVGPHKFCTMHDAPCQGCGEGAGNWIDVATWSADVDPSGFDTYFSTNPPVTIPAGTTQIAFHYTDDEGWAWGAHVDNIDLGGTVYDFESGAMGWTVDDRDGNPPTWEYGNTVTPIGDVGGAVGSWFFIDDDAAGSGAGASTDNWLLSPTFPALASDTLLTFDGDFENVNLDDKLTVKANVPAGGIGPTPSFPAEPIDEALIWDTEIEDAYAATFFGDWEYDIPVGCTLSLELSSDGGENWFIISEVEGPDTYGPDAIQGTPFDLTPWAGSSILIRVHIVSEGLDSGYVCVDNFRIKGKQDRVPPTASISLSGNLVGPGQYAGPVTATITATDDQAVGEIHYILDGEETVISGSSTTFTVTGDGDHTIEYWAVDATGNEGAHSTVTFNIDNTPPTVEIVAPEPGLYLFGNKLLDMSKPFIIGAFTAEAVADDSQGVAVVQFLLNGEIVGEDTEAPFDTYVAVKNMGAAELGVTAIDGVGNSAEDSMDITYYKFL